jgi:Ca2+-dependent lipid-binding protein
LKGFDLKPMDRNGFSDPYVIFNASWLGDKPKTEFVRKTLNPEWSDNQVPVLEPITRIPYLIHSHLWLELMDHDDASNDDEMGIAVLSLKALFTENEPVDFECEVLRLGQRWGTIKGTIQILREKPETKITRKKTERK